MNIDDAIVTEEFKEGLQTISEQDIKVFFESIIATKTNQLKGIRDVRALTDLNANVMLINELRELLLQLRKQ